MFVLIQNKIVVKKFHRWATAHEHARCYSCPELLSPLCNYEENLLELETNLREVLCFKITEKAPTIA